MKTIMGGECKNMKRLLFVFVFAVILGTAAVSADSLTVYPEYPDIVTKDTDYTVTVSQGSRTETIPVYSMCRQTGSQVKDNYRRFSEFEFEGTVTVRITSDKFDMSKAQVMPEYAAENASYADGVLTVVLERSGSIAVNVNKDYRTTIGIFAEAPQTDIPEKNDSNVLYYEAGYHNTDSVLTLTAGKTLYLEPGAVLDANIRVNGDGVTIRGRGIIRDRLYGTASVLTPVVKINDNIKNVNIEDIKFLDSKTFVLVGNYKNSAVVIDNVKILSNKANSDAVSFWNGASDITVKNSYIFNGDNVFVSSGNCDNMVFQDCIVGTSAALVACSKEMTGSIKVQDIDVFAASIVRHSNLALVINNAYSTDVAEGCTYTVDSVVLENIDASYCKSVPQLFAGNGPGEGNKSFSFKNVYLPDGVNTGVRIISGGNYQIALEDVWFGENCVNSESAVRAVDSGDGTSQIAYSRNNFDARIFINGYLLRTGEVISVTGDDVLLPINRILLPLGAKADFNEAGGAVITNGDTIVSMSESSNTAYINGQETAMPVPMQKIQNVLCIPVGFLCRAFGAEAVYDADTAVMSVAGDALRLWYDEPPAAVKPCGAELLDNADFELTIDDTGLYGYGWEAHNDSVITKVTNEEEAVSGTSYLRISDRKHGYSGLRQIVTRQLETNGPGKYTLSMYVRAADPESEIVGQQFHMTLGIISGEMADEKTYAKFYTMTDSWQKIENTFTVSWDGKLEMARLVAVGTKSYTDDFLIDKFSFTKVRTSFVMSSDKSSVTVNVGEHEQPLDLSVILAGFYNGTVQKVHIVPYTFEAGENQCTISLSAFDGVNTDEIRCMLWNPENCEAFCPMEVITER